MSIHSFVMTRASGNLFDVDRQKDRKVRESTTRDLAIEGTCALQVITLSVPHLQ